jgi:uncharacterized protein (TIGR03435 family)
MRIILTVLALSVVLATSGRARQRDAAATFEVASIRQTEFPNEAYFSGFADGAGMCGMWRFTVVGNRVSLRSVNLCSLIRMAYDVKDYQIVAPAWVTKKDPSVFFEIEGRAADGTTITVEQARLMLQSLLADRFKMTFHREPRAAPVYALMVGNRGHKLGNQEIPCPNKASFISGSGTLTSCRPQMSVAQIAFALSRELDRVVVDKTNLTGQYAFALRWSSTDPLSGGDNLPSLFTAVQEQLGLKLDASTEPVDALVIDHIEPPSPN